MTAPAIGSRPLRLRDLVLRRPGNGTLQIAVYTTGRGIAFEIDEHVTIAELADDLNSIAAELGKLAIEAAIAASKP